MRRVLLVALLAGCPPPVTYGYQYKITQQFDGGGDQPEPAPVEARQLLASAKTVAFFPPDICVNVDASQGATKVKELKANCGVLLSALERAAEHAGYEVYSWQNLRGAGRAIDFAREAKVDVLFEINEFDLAYVDDSTVQRTLGFFEDTTTGTTALAVSQQLAKKCKDYDARNPVRPVAVTGAIDIKTVAVADGRDRWHYRKTLEVPIGRTYDRETFTHQPKSHPLARSLFIFGILGVVTSIELFVLPSVLHSDPTTKQIDVSPWQWISGVAGLAALGGAYAANKNLGGQKLSPDVALCEDSYLTRKAPPPTVVAPNSAEHTFTETTGGDASRKYIEQVRTSMIADFIAVLGEVHGMRH